MKPIATTGKQMQARCCALSVVNHLKKVNTQLTTIVALGEPVAVATHGAEIAAELRMLNDMLDSVALLHPLKG